VWDSDAEEERQECQVKSRVLHETPNFELLETMRYDPENGIFLLDYHLERLMTSATYFDIPFHKQDILQKLNDIKPKNAQKIRLLLTAKGDVRVECFALSKMPSRPVKLELATDPIGSDDIFLYHKTTYRKAYERARQNHPESDNVILWNERGELTETTIHNIILKFGEKLYTPPVECGLLAGTFRAWMLGRGEVQEKVLTRRDLRHCDAIYVINSVQGQRQAVVLDNSLKNSN
jgi:para-aminobenzoate synthetase/4-amino-4-deoxychorismate lyase